METVGANQVEAVSPNVIRAPMFRAQVVIVRRKGSNLLVSSILFEKMYWLRRFSLFRRVVVCKDTVRVLPRDSPARV